MQPRRVTAPRGSIAQRHGRPGTDLRSHREKRSQCGETTGQRGGNHPGNAKTQGSTKECPDSSLSKARTAPCRRHPGAGGQGACRRAARLKPTTGQDNPLPPVPRSRKTRDTLVSYTARWAPGGASGRREKCARRKPLGREERGGAGMEEEAGNEDRRGTSRLSQEAKTYPRIITAMQLLEETKDE